MADLSEFLATCADVPASERHARRLELISTRRLVDADIDSSEHRDLLAELARRGAGDPRSEALQLAHDYWQQRLAVRSDPRESVAAGAWWVGEGLRSCFAPQGEDSDTSPKLSEAFYDYSANFAWYTRNAASWRADPIRGLPRGPRTDPSSSTADAELFAALIGAQRLRFQGRYRQLRQYTTELLAGWKADPMLRALLALAAFAEQQVDEGGRSLDAALAHPHCFGRCRHVCLEALCLAHGLEDQGGRIVALGVSMRTRDGEDPNLLRRLAYGLVLQQDWDEALRALNDASSAIHEHHDETVQREIERTRELIQTSRSVRLQLEAEAAERQQGFARFADEQKDELRRSTRSQVLSIVQVVATFSAIIALVLASVDIAADQTDVDAATQLILVLGGVLGAFVLLLSAFFAVALRDAESDRVSRVAVLGVVAGAVMAFAVSSDAFEQVPVLRAVDVSTAGAIILIVSAATICAATFGRFLPRSRSAA